VSIARKVRKVLPEIKKILPEGMNIEFNTDRTIFTEQSIREIKLQLVIGGMMAAFVIFFFLQNFRTTLISAIAIPTSIISTFACMYTMGFTMNNLTMLGLVMAVGLVIDDAIVMVENIFRHRSTLNKESMKAAFEGSDEIGFAIISTTMVLAGVFIPVAFMGGVIGRFFYEFAVTVAFAVGCSTFVALTVVPMLSSRFLTLKGEGDSLKVLNRIMNRGSTLYRKSIFWFLHHRFIVLVIAIVVLIFGVLIFFRLGKELVTDEDGSMFFIRVETPLSYSIEKTDEVMRRMEKKVRAIPEIKTFFSFGGYGGQKGEESNKGIAFVRMVPKNERTRTQKEVQSVVQSIFREMPDVKGTASEYSLMGAGARSENIQFVIQGQDVDGLDLYSRRIMKRLEGISGYVGITRDLEIGKPEVQIKIDREKAADAGISVQNIAYAVGALMGGIDVNVYKEGGKSYDVRLRLVREQRLVPEDIQNIWIRSADGKLFDITNFTTIEVGIGPNAINRLDRQRSTTVYANIEGKLLGEALSEVQQIGDEILPKEYSTKFTGKAEIYDETIRAIGFAFILGIIFTYMVLAAQFESFSQPFAIMMGLPLSYIGAFGMLYLLNNTFNLFSMIGLIFLIGLATKNGILLIDYTNQLRKKGLSLNDSLIEAGATRLRPILMTAISTIAGVFPVALGIGIGSETRQSMAVAILGGLISSTVLTLAVVPVIYSYLDQVSNWKLFKKFRKKIMTQN
jgi:HAE1 family hydrophobic/amphiphilic exporter-1